MRFNKFTKISNHYQKKEIKKTFKYHPELKSCSYIVEHKLDGANIQFVFSPESTFDTFLICSKNHPLDRNSRFQKVDLKELIEDSHYEAFATLQDIAIKKNITLNVYGELFGASIQKRIDYGPEPQVLFFGLKINEEWVSQQEMYFLFADFAISHYLVSSFGIMSFEEALEFDIHRSAEEIFGGEEIEGIVIKPWDIASTFYLKKKGKKFLEKTKRKVIKNKEFSYKVNELKSIFNEFLTENRVKSIFSHYGEIETPSQIGDYIKYVLNDAKEDFFEEGNSIEGLEKEEIKYIFNGSKHIVKILQNYL